MCNCPKCQSGNLAGVLSMLSQVIVAVLTSVSATSLFIEHAQDIEPTERKRSRYESWVTEGEKHGEDLHALSFVTFDQGIQLISPLIQVRIFDTTLRDRQHQDLGTRLQWKRGDVFDLIVKLDCRDTIGNIVRST